MEPTREPNHRPENSGEDLGHERMKETTLVVIPPIPISDWQLAPIILQGRPRRNRAYKVTTKSWQIISAGLVARGVRLTGRSLAQREHASCKTGVFCVPKNGPGDACTRAAVVASFAPFPAPMNEPIRHVHFHRHHLRNCQGPSRW
jgi:hypothetical protein